MAVEDVHIVLNTVESVKNKPQQNRRLENKTSKLVRTTCHQSV
jgi:hypothetical protein